MKRILIIAAFAVATLLCDTYVAHCQTKGGVVSASSVVVTRTKVKKVKEPIKIKWQNNIDATITQHYAVTYTGGWRFGNFMFLGFGTGVQVHPKVLPWDENGMFVLKGEDKQDIRDMKANYDSYNPSRISVPIHAQVRFRFMKTKVAPYLAASGGLLINGDSYGDDVMNRDYDSEIGYYWYENHYKKNGLKGTYYGEVLIGVDFRLKNSSSISFGLGPMWTGQKENYLYGYDSEEGMAIGGFKLGYSF